MILSQFKENGQKKEKTGVFSRKTRCSKTTMKSAKALKYWNKTAVRRKVEL
jgi:hypothetical protein